MQADLVSLGIDKKSHITIFGSDLRAGHNHFTEDFTSFRNIFRRYTGLTPQEYKKKFSRLIKDDIIQKV